MKTKSLIVIAAAFGLAGGAHAEEGKKDRPHRKLPPEVVEKFDKDGDGKLNEDEREAAKAARGERMKVRWAERLKRFDADGDGQLSETEREAMKSARKKMMLEKFDKDGDGELSGGERTEARKSMGGRRPGGPEGGKRMGPRKRPGGGTDEEAPGASGEPQPEQ